MGVQWLQMTGALHILDYNFSEGKIFPKQSPFLQYRNDPKFSDRYAWANSADPDQTAPSGAV